MTEPILNQKPPELDSSEEIDPEALRCVFEDLLSRHGEEVDLIDPESEEVKQQLESLTGDPKTDLLMIPLTTLRKNGDEYHRYWAFNQFFEFGKIDPVIAQSKREQIMARHPVSLHNYIFVGGKVIDRRDKGWDSDKHAKIDEEEIELSPEEIAVLYKEYSNPRLMTVQEFGEQYWATRAQ